MLSPWLIYHKESQGQHLSFKDLQSQGLDLVSAATIVRAALGTKSCDPEQGKEILNAVHIILGPAP